MPPRAAQRSILMSTNTLKRIGEAYSLFGRALNGDLHAKADVAESLTTSDFPVLLGQGYQRKLLAAYQAQTPVWQQYATRTVDRKSTRLNSSHVSISYAVFCLKKKTKHFPPYILLSHITSPPLTHSSS